MGNAVLEGTLLDLSTLYLLSEELADDFKQQVEAAVLDCRQRPEVQEAREVRVTLRLTPDKENPDNVLIAPVSTSKTPARKLETITARRTSRNQLQFDFTEE